MYSRNFSSRALRLAVTVALAAAMPAFADQADQTPATDSAAAAPGQLEEVTVSARRRDESLQDVPVTVTAFGDAQLAQQDIRSAVDLQSVVPGLAVAGSRGFTSFPFIRGLRGVVGYFAEVPTTLMGNPFYFDVGSVQVLKGPQGTLFGLSTNGGAILHEPKRPEEAFGGFAGLTLGDHSRQTYEGVLNVPVSDKLLVRFGGQYQKSDTTIHDTVRGDGYDSEDYWVGRVGVAFRPTDSVENYLVINNYSSHGKPYTFVPYEVNSVYYQFSNPALGAQLQRLVQQIRDRGFYTLLGTSIPEGSKSKRDALNVVDHLSWEITDSLAIKNILGYAESRDWYRADIDGTPFRIADLHGLGTKPFGPIKTWTEELQLQGKASDDKLVYVVGTFHLWDKSTKDTTQYTDLTDLFGIATGLATHTENAAHAVYAEGTYSFTDKWSATAGARYTKDHKEIAQSNSLVIPGVGEIDTGDTSDKAAWSAISWRVGAQYQASAATMLYATISKGHYSGGFNLTAPPSARTYDPESLVNYELGIKSEWDLGDMRARTNLAAYYGDHQDVQAMVNVLVPLPGGGTTLATVTNNAASGEIKGVEASVTLLPTDALELSVDFGWMDASYTEYKTLDPTGTVAIDASNTPYVYVPEWKYAIHGRYHLPEFGNVGAFTVSVDYSDQAELYNDANPNPQYYDKVRSIENLEAAITWNNMLGREGLSARLFGSNLTDNHWASSQLAAYRSLGLWGQYPAPPRAWGVTLRYEF
jgi:iron complex outermembrane receptor protein